MIDKKNYSLLAHNTFGIDVRCRRFVEYGSVEEAQELVRTLTPEDGPLLILGGGSNLLLTGDYEGTVIHSAIRFIEPLGEGRVRCGSGQEWDAFVAWCVANGYHGAENLSLIPGECGASAVQNIGAYGAEACNLIEEVEAVEIATGRLCRLKGSDCGYSYRQSRFKHEWRDRFTGSPHSLIPNSTMATSVRPWPRRPSPTPRRSRCDRRSSRSGAANSPTPRSLATRAASS